MNEHRAPNTANARGIHPRNGGAGPARCGGGPPRRPAVLLVALLVLLAAGCSSSNGTTAPVASPGSAVPAATESPVRGASGPSAGCGAKPSVPVGQDEVHLSSRGADRWYLRHVPPGHDGTTPVPLVVDFHGYAEGAQFHTSVSGLGPLGDREGFVTISPHGQGAPVHWDANLGSPDLAFVGEVLDQVEAQLCIDRARVFVTGFSNGAFLTSTIACQYADRVAAVAPVAGLRDVPGCAPVRPVPVIAFHGTADHFVEYGGGMGASAAKMLAPDGSGRTLGEVPETNQAVVPGSMDQPMPDIVKAWATRNGCQAAPTERAVAVDVTLVSFPCPAGRDVELHRVEAGGHAWPGSAGSVAIGNVVGPTTMNIDASALMWAFFVAHPMPG